MPFVWEGENYLVKLKTDSFELANTNLAKFFNFSTEKSDPFLVFPSIKPTAIP